MSDQNEEVPWLPSLPPPPPSKFLMPQTPAGYVAPPANILCPDLYSRLQKRFSGGVEVANQGEAQQGRIVQEVRGQQFIDRWQIGSWGETYRINCPYCNDTRHRLWINHRYGQPDPASPNQRGSFYGICYNENCLADSGNRQHFYDEVFRLRNRNEHAPRMDVMPGTRTDTRLVKREPPGHVELLTSVPHLPGLDYMVGERRFDHATLDYYGVQLCLQVFKDEFRTAQGRITFPIYMHGEYVGWQTRFVGEPTNKRIPKYYTCPGMPTRHILYNYDRAKSQPFVVLFEGITDVMRFGDASTAIFGKKLKPDQALLIAGTWTEGQPIIVCFDAAAYEESQAAIELLGSLCSNPVIRVKLQDGWDPADYDRAALHYIIRSQVQERGITLPALA